MLNWKAPDDVIQIRKELCESCESYTALNTCSECNCFVPFRITVKNTRCPLYKWYEVEDLDE